MTHTRLLFMRLEYTFQLTYFLYEETCSVKHVWALVLANKQNSLILQLSQPVDFQLSFEIRSISNSKKN